MLIPASARSNRCTHVPEKRTWRQRADELRSPLSGL